MAERVYKMRLEELRKELAGLKNDKISWMKDDPNMENKEAQASLRSAWSGRDGFCRAGPGDRLLKRFCGRLQVVQAS